jgi:NAD(P)-dependent dehydrogenase (short-subunit alcohol dehydrogenase family)
MKIQGAVVIVTGASSGIGAATVRMAAARGATVILAARRADRITALAAELPGSLAVPTDMRDAAQVRRLVETALERFGRVDVLVNNAGQGLHVPLEQVRPDDFRSITELNVFAPLLAMQAVIPSMRERGGGAIVNVSSMTSRMALPGLGAYAATKAALNMLSQVARRELAADGIVVSTVYPAVTATEFHQSLAAGGRVGGGWGGPPPHPAELVAEAILGLVESGEEEALIKQDWGGASRGNVAGQVR